VLTRQAVPPEEAVHWESSADGQLRGNHPSRRARTTVILHLKEDAKEFAQGYRLRSLVRRYSDHIAFPVRMPKEARQRSNTKRSIGSGLWTRPRSDIKGREYRDLYRHISHEAADPLAWSHNRVEGKREYTACFTSRHARRSTCGSARRPRIEAVCAARIHHG